MATAGSGVLLVGELNPYGADPEMALYHRPRHASGNRLRMHLGLSDAAYAKLKKINLCTGKWSLPAARERAMASLNQVSVDLGLIVMLGSKVRQAFNFERLAFFEGTQAWSTLAVVSLPHPSGLNRLWNAPGARAKARSLLNSIYPDVPWGSVSE